jgi:hypothetical protein
MTIQVSTDKRYIQKVKELTARGWTCRPARRGGHALLFPPNLSARPISVPCTPRPDQGRTWQNFLAQIARAERATDVDMQASPPVKARHRVKPRKATWHEQ